MDESFWLLNIEPVGVTFQLKHYTKDHKGRIADWLIAQSCIDHEVALITRDYDFRRIAKVAGLGLERL